LRTFHPFTTPYIRIILTTNSHRLSTIMKADRILVVMNGAVVEEGSHDELIHKKGKYHDLWSKQIMVTPMTDRSRSRSPKKQDLNIINDLTPNRSKVELAKILYSAPHDETCQSNSPKPDVIQIPVGEVEGMNQDPGKIEQGKKSAEDLQSGSVHQREVSAKS
jgi:ABC-type multidrug transport system ATPase subunit